VDHQDVLGDIFSRISMDFLLLFGASSDV